MCRIHDCNPCHVDGLECILKSHKRIIQVSINRMRRNSSIRININYRDHANKNSHQASFSLNESFLLSFFHLFLFHFLKIRKYEVNISFSCLWLPFVLSIFLYFFDFCLKEIVFALFLFKPKSHIFYVPLETLVLIVLIKGIFF